LPEAVSHAPAWFRRALVAPRESRRVEVAGCPIHYLRWGELGRPGIVLVHGGAAHAHWWTHVAPLLAGEYAVAAIDLSGHGDSGWRDAYSTELWSDEIMTVADHADFAGPPILVAHSMGGFISVLTAARYGDRLAGAVILDSPVSRPDPEAQEAAYGRAFKQPRTYPDAATALRHYRLVPDQPWVNPWIMDYVARTSIVERDGRWCWKWDVRVFQKITPHAIREVLPRVGCRVALFRGENGLVTPDIGEYMYELMHRNAPVVEIPEAYHHMMLDQPMPLLAALRALLADWEHSVPRHRAAPRPG
jgi:pimeloyl-ACP methyl ester carboxylesterase